MSSNLQAVEWAGLVAGSGLGGSVLTKILDWRISKATAKGAEKKTSSETNKIDIDAAEVIAKTAMSLLAPLQAEIADLRSRIEHLEGENLNALGKLRRAVHHIRELRMWIAARLAPDDCPPAPPPDLDI